MKIEINDINIHIKFLYNKAKNLENCLKDFIGEELFIELNNMYKLFLEKFNNKLNIKSDKKINDILKIQFNNIQNEAIRNEIFVDNKQNKILNNNSNNIDNSNNNNNNSNDNNNNNWFVNLTDEIIPDRVINTVSKGQKFSLNTSLDNKNAFDTIKNIEQLFNNYEFDSEVVNDIRYSVISNINKHLNKNKHISMLEKCFQDDIIYTKKYLKNTNHNIFFTNADKGNSTVALDRSFYNLKMENEILNDSSTYIQLDFNPLTQLRKDTQNFLHVWNINGFLNKSYHDWALTQTDTVLPRLYGLPKIHKIIMDHNGILHYKLRPVLSTINTPTHFLAKFISTLLTTSIKKPVSCIKNSQHFISKISEVSIPDNHILISLDATSLFTNVPVDLVKNSIEKRFNQINKFTVIPLNELFNAIDFLSSNTFLQFNNKFYRQIYGCPMGSSVSSIFADMVLDDLETHCLNILDFKPAFYYRYVDDIITCVPIDKVQKILDTFNSYHPRLQFTLETEIDNSINFLDLKLIKENNSIIHN